MRDLTGSLDVYRKELLGQGFAIAKKKGYEITDEGMLCDWLLENGYDSIGQALNKSRNYIESLNTSCATMKVDYLEKLNEDRYNRKR
jgi:hypothetical protein